MSQQKIHTCDFAQFDFSNYPLVIVTLLNIDPDLDQIREYVRLQDELVDSTQGNFVIVVDGGELDWISGSSRILLNELIAAFERRNKDRLLKTFFVARTVFHKIALKGYNRINRPIITQVVVTSLEDGIQLAKEALGSKEDQP